MAYRSKALVGKPVMGNMDGWDVALLVGAGYIAAVSLVRLMIRHRDQKLSEFRRQMAAEKSNQKKRQSQQEPAQDDPQREAA